MNALQNASCAPKTLRSKNASKDSNKSIDNNVNGNFESNLSNEELLGIKSLKKRVKEGSIVICETDKSKRFAVMTKEQFIASGNVHTCKDIVLSQGQIKKLQISVNNHSWWLGRITNCGSNWGHESRMAKNINDEGEQTCNMSLLIKDHKNWKIGSKTPPPHVLWFRATRG